MKKLFNTKHYSLAWIIKKSNEIRKLDQQVKEVLDQRLVSHCKVANFENGCLVICIDNPSSATLLRFQLPELMQKLRQRPELEQLLVIKYYIETKEEKQNKSTGRVLPVSQETVAEIKESIVSLPHLKLRDTIERLVKHLEKMNKG